MNGSINGGNSSSGYYGSGDNNSYKVNNKIDVHKTVPTQPHRTLDRGTASTAEPAAASSSSSATKTAAPPTTATTLNHQTVNQRLAFSVVEDEVITERRYGCYRLGIAAAILIILILIAGTIPIIFAIDDRRLMLIAIGITIATVAALVFVYVCWQHRSARHQREKFGREWVTTTNRHNAQYRSVPSSQHTSWLFASMAAPKRTPTKVDAARRLAAPQEQKKQQRL